ncbi:MAG: hypothetical protein V7K49_23815 [Nostoc sp.]
MPGFYDQLVRFYTAALAFHTDNGHAGVPSRQNLYQLHRQFLINCLSLSQSESSGVAG